jgi:chorismate-pyruvate lyase
MVDVGTPSELERALGRQSGTVTAFLERLVGEPVDANCRRQESAGAGSSSALQVSEGHPLLHRTAVLQGRMSGQAFVYAESVIVTSRLSHRFRLRLDSTSDPIGRILEDEALVVTRVHLCGADLADAGIPAGSGARPPAGDFLLARSYRIDIATVPVMVITEWFLPSLSRYLPAGPG